MWFTLFGACCVSLVPSGGGEHSAVAYLVSIHLSSVHYFVIQSTSVLVVQLYQFLGLTAPSHFQSTKCVGAMMVVVVVDSSVTDRIISCTSEIFTNSLNFDSDSCHQRLG